MLSLPVKQSIVKYPFPVKGDDSMMFSMKGARLDKALLLVNDRILSVFKPPTTQVINDVGPSDDHDDSSLDDPAAEIGLDFFGGVPLHAALLGKAVAQIILYVKGKQIPSLTIQIMRECITWEKLGTDVHREIVVVYNEAGVVSKKTLLYHISGIVGYERCLAAPTEATSSSTNDAQKS